MSLQVVYPYQKEMSFIKILSKFLHKQCSFFLSYLSFSDIPLSEKNTGSLELVAFKN